MPILEENSLEQLFFFFFNNNQEEIEKKIKIIQDDFTSFCSKYKFLFKIKEKIQFFLTYDKYSLTSPRFYTDEKSFKKMLKKLEKIKIILETFKKNQSNQSNQKNQLNELNVQEEVEKKNFFSIHKTFANLSEFVQFLKNFIITLTDVLKKNKNAVEVKFFFL